MVFDLLVCMGVQDTPDGGYLRVGDTVAPLYVDQSRDALVSEKTVFEEITDGLEEVQLGQHMITLVCFILLRKESPKSARYDTRFLISLFCLSSSLQAKGRLVAGHIARGSTSKVQTSKKGSACSLAENGIGAYTNLNSNFVWK